MNRRDFLSAAGVLVTASALPKALRAAEPDAQPFGTLPTSVTFRSGIGGTHEPPTIWHITQPVLYRNATFDCRNLKEIHVDARHMTGVPYERLRETIDYDRVPVSFMNCTFNHWDLPDMKVSPRDEEGTIILSITSCRMSSGVWKPNLSGGYRL